MLISHEHKFAFFRIPKTGSTTVETLLRMTGVPFDFATPLIQSGIDGINFTQPDMNVNVWHYVHATPLQALSLGWMTQQQINTYSLYGFWRDPEDRWVSITTHSLPMMVPELFHEFTTNENVNLRLLSVEQTSYRPVTFLPFNNFANSVNFLCQQIGHPGFPVVPSLNQAKRRMSREEKDVLWTPELRDIVRARFPNDFAYRDQLLNTTRTQP